MWLRIECKGHVSEMNSGPFNNPFITLCCDGSSVTSKFCVFFQPVAMGSLDTGCFLTNFSQILDMKSAQDSIVIHLIYVLRLNTCMSGESHSTGWILVAVCSGIFQKIVNSYQLIHCTMLARHASSYTMILTS